MTTANLRKIMIVLGISWATLGARHLEARSSVRFQLSPFVSISSTKSVKPGANKTESETTKQRTTYGIRAGLHFWRLLGIELSVGQNELDTEEKVSEAKDEFDEINYEEDLNMSTDDPDKLIRIKETQRKAKLTVSLDPGFWIFIFRAKAGVQATQRLLHKEEEGVEDVDYESPITYNPVAGAGAGVRLGRTAKFMAEYEFNFYKFPEYEPFEREVSVSFSVNL